MKILYEDNSIIVINKPAGTATQSANIASKDCVSLIKQHLKKENPNIKGEPYVGVIHRLDQPVSGILVFAKDSKSAAKLSAQVGGTQMNKIYNALVDGIFPVNEERTLTNMIYKDSKEKKACIVDDKADSNKLPKDVKVQKAILSYKVESADVERNTSFLKITLKTGRFHQIRAQLSHLGHPIAGDKKYGSEILCPSDFDINNTNPKAAIALMACSLEFMHPLTGKIMKFDI